MRNDGGARPVGSDAVRTGFLHFWGFRGFDSGRFQIAMAGVKGRSGGRRAGAGRKRQETVVEQASRRGIVLEVIDDEEWRATLKAWLKLSRKAPSVLYPLLPYLLGGVKQEVEHSGKVEHVQIEAARRLLRVVGGTES